MKESAYAKINLALHVTGKRGDGFHLLDSLVVFTECADELHLTVAPAGAKSEQLKIDGAFAKSLINDDPKSNLIIRSERLFYSHFPKHSDSSFSWLLTKNLPVASGIGGGSADAAAALRLLCRVEGISERDPKVTRIANSLGADVSVCLNGESARMQGIGEILLEVGDLPILDLVLVNPGIAVSTPSVFSRLQTINNSPLTENKGIGDTEKFLEWLKQQRNDLQEPATAIAPDIESALDQCSSLAGCLLARMSGSGATIFGVFANQDAAQTATSAIRSVNPTWWVQATRTRRGSGQ